MIPRGMRLSVMLAMGAALLAVAPSAGAARAELAPPPDFTGLEPGTAPTAGPLLPDEVSAEACATTASGRRLACMQVHRDADGTADGVACVYDDALGIFGWGFRRALTCVETTEDWGFIGGAGLCERSLGLDRPDACVNGRDECLLWVWGLQVVCRVQD